MTNPTLIATPFAENGDKNIIPESVGTEPQNATMQDGFPPITQQKVSEGGIPPERNDFNGILNLYGQHIVHLNKGLPYEFDQDFANKIGGYPLNARLMLSSGEIVQSTIANNTNNPNTDMTGWAKINSASQIIDDNGQTQQKINDQFKTLTNFYVTPENYGAKDGDWWEAIQWCVDTGKEVVLSASVYNVSKPIYLSRQQHKIRGAGGKVSVINKIGDTKLGLADVVRDGKTFNIDKDAVFICYNTNHQQLNFEHFRIQKNYRDDEQYTGYGLFAPFISEFVNIDFFSWFVYYGFYTIDCWMSTWIRCHTTAKAGFILGGLDSDSDFLRGGTSLTLISCWSTNTGENESAYRIHGFAYSNAISCGSDNVGSEGKPAFSTWYFNQCPSFNLSSCGGEAISAKHLFYVVERSQVNVQSHYITHFYNKYKDNDSPYLIFVQGSSKLTIENSKIPFLYEVVDGYPNFAAADYESSLSIKECEHYPPITGKNNGNFGVYSLRRSYISFSNKGYSFEESDASSNNNVADFKLISETNIPQSSSATSGIFGLVGSAGQWDTSLQRINEVRIWWDPTTEMLRAKNFSDPTSSTNGYTLGGCQKGPTAQRPTTLTIGMMYLDTTLAPEGKPIWVSGPNTWVDALGNKV